MRALSASEWLGVWEQGLAQLPFQKALTILTAACPETTPEGLAKFSIGQRDAHLLTLREWTFGGELVGLASCPQCAEGLELAFDVADIRVSSHGEASLSGVEDARTFSVSVAAHEVTFRLPNSLDLEAMGSDDPDVIRRKLLERCLLAIYREGEQRPFDYLPEEVAAAVVERMEQADPQGNVQLALSCPSCKHEWEAAFDIVSFFWAEINAWAYRILREVHTLASAYGWREVDILAMSPWRREAYLSVVAE